MKKVSAINTEAYIIEDLIKIIKSHFDYFNIQDKIKKDSKVIIKPNLLMKRAPELFTTTHPSIVEAVIIYLKNIGVTNITIADSPGGPFTKAALSGIYKVTGMEEVAKKHSINLNYDFSSSNVNISGKVMYSVDIINVIKDADVIINLPKLKTHAMTGLSAGVKNLFGVVPGLKKPELHFRFPDKNDFCNMLVDLGAYVKPVFTIVDAVESMEGDGPSGGKLKKTKMTFGAEDIFTLDRVMADYIDVNYNEILTISNSIKRELTTENINEIEIIGDGYIKQNDFVKAKSKQIDFTGSIPKIIPKKIVTTIEKAISPKPKIIKSKCIGCGKCQESCPAKTIDIINKKAIIKYDKCIKCFCCHEMCPIKAIKITR